MPPFWDPSEADSEVYKKVQKHSDGLISFSYQPLSEADQEALKNTETYREIERQSNNE